MADLLGADFGLAEAHKLYACHDLLLQHKDALFPYLMARWRDLFNANFDVLLYDLTSTYPRVKPEGMLRDQCLGRGGGRQAPPRLQSRQTAGLPAGGDCTGGHSGRSAAGLEVLPGNTADCTMLRMFLARIEQQYDRAQRVWVI